MPITTYTALERPNSINGAADTLANVIEEFTGMVEGTIARRSSISNMIPVRPVKGTATITNFAMGGSTLGVVTPGQVPEGFANDVNKASLTIDTVVYARSIIPLLDTFQTQFDARAEIANEHGKEISKFYDQSFYIQAIRAAQQANSTFYGNSVNPDGHSGGSTQTLTGASDHLDPAKLYSAMAQLFVKFENKDVDPRLDDLMVVVKPAEFYTLWQTEQLINTEYVTAAGNKIDNVPVLKAYGVPVISSNNFPGGSNISGHKLSTAANSNAYDVDCTKVVAVAFSPRALLAGETIPLTGDVFYDKLSKQWFVDAHLSYGVTPNRAEFAGVIMKP